MAKEQQKQQFSTEISEKKEWFEAWFDSDYYHILYKKRDEQEAKLFLNNLQKMTGWNDHYRAELLL